MKTKTEWEAAIADLTDTIRQKHPELSKYISEMPVNNSQKENVNNKNLEDYYHSLMEVLETYSITHSATDKSGEAPIFPGYPLYPPSEDIYSNFKEVSSLNPEDISKKKAPNEDAGTLNEKDFEDDMTGDDLDVPGSELDDRQENIGSEDEENNYYSLGGDNHDN